MTRKQFQKLNTVKLTVNGIKLDYTPIVYDCTYHQPDKKTKKCVNCNDTMFYVDGYYMTYKMKNGKKVSYMVDNIK